MRKLVVIAVLVSASFFAAGYAISGPHSEPSSEAPSTSPGAEVLVADEHGDVLRCNGKVARVKVNLPPPAAGPAQATKVDRQPKPKRYACAKDRNGRETGELEEVETP